LKGRIAAMPKLGDYNVPLNLLLERTLDCRVINCPAITKKTVEIGAKHSPDTVCTPFKILMGQFIQVLDHGANTIVMPAFGCRLGFYDILHKQILEDLGYKFEMLTLFDYNATANKLFNSLSAANPNLTRERFDEVLLLTARIVVDMDKLADTMRKNAGFEVHRHAFEKSYKAYLAQVPNLKTFDDAIALGERYKKSFAEIEINKPENPIRVGLVGDLYSVIEPHGNCDLVKWLVHNGVEVWNKIDMTYLSTALFNVNPLIAASGGYATYWLGGNANSSVALALEFAKGGVDGIIHVKAATCTPEITAMSILQNISRDTGVPIMYLTFDTETAEAGMHTRWEAFLDMIEMRKGGKK
jgi:predicted nucleotide-binding protein (sugar kinase/HSP70/actin superfamily)